MWYPQEVEKVLNKILTLLTKHVTTLHMYVKTFKSINFYSFIWILQVFKVSKTNKNIYLIPITYSKFHKHVTLQNLMRHTNSFKI